MNEVLGCSVVYCHHHSKGYQGLKSSMDRMSGSGVFARDPDAILDMTPLAATTDELKAARDSIAMEEILSTLAERGLVPPTYSDAAPLAVWAIEHLYKRDGDALNERLAAILEGASSIAAWRVSFTLREFENAQSMDVWFDYPLHVPDHRRVLAQCPYDGDSRSHDGSGRSRARAREEKQRTLEEAFEAVSMGEDTVRIDDMAEYLGVSPKTVKRRIDESRSLERNDGYVRRRA